MVSSAVPGLVLALLAMRNSVSAHHPEFDPGDPSYLLPGGVVPDHYRLWLTPHFENFTVDGKVEIEVTCVNATWNITLHADASLVVNLSTVAVYSANISLGNLFRPGGLHRDQAREFLILDLQGQLEPGREYTVSMSFTAPLRDDVDGLYRGSYLRSAAGGTAGEEEEVEVVHLASTQFEPTHARKAFPCFDQPDLKATFEVSLGRIWYMSSLANMPPKERGTGVPMKCNDAYVWDHYQTTVPMSTYLNAFVVSDFGYRESDGGDDGDGNGNGGGVRFRIWSRKEFLRRTRYAASVAPRISRFFEDYLEVPYPLPKQDMIAIPDFGAGAMENWGLITYRENLLLYDPSLPSRSARQSIAAIVAHELAHQWFGNLVTMHRWGDLWLNEGFASYLEYLGVDAAEPEMRIMDQFVVVDVHRAMAADAWRTSREVSNEVYTPAAIETQFDSIAYQKGASLIHMMRHFLGEETFRRGLNRYLNQRQYDSAARNDLFAALEEQTEQLPKGGLEDLPEGVTLREVMESWTVQPGYPVVTVTVDYERGSISFTQDPFGFTTYAADGRKWWIPVTARRAGGGGKGSSNKDDEDDSAATFFLTWLSPDKEEVLLPKEDEEDDQVLIINPKATGFYRVNYDPETWTRVRAVIPSLDVSTRAQLLDDAFSLAKAGILDYGVALGMTGYLEGERHFVPWRPANSALRYLGAMLRRTPEYGEYQEFMRHLVRPSYRAALVRQKGEEEEESLLESELAEVACDEIRLEECVRRAVEDFRQWRRQPDSSELRRAVYHRRSACAAVSEGGLDEWLFVLDRFRAADGGRDRGGLLRALSCTRHIWLLNRLMFLALDKESGIRYHEVASVFSSVAGRDHGRDVAFDFIRANFKAIEERLGETGLDSVISGSLANRNTEFELQEILNFREVFSDHLQEKGKKSLARAIEVTRFNIVWMEKRRGKVLNWIRRKNEERAERE